MTLVVIGMDPHKRSATIEVMAGDEAVAGAGLRRVPDLPSGVRYVAEGLIRAVCRHGHAT